MNKVDPSPVGPRQAIDTIGNIVSMVRLLIRRQKSENDYEKRVHAGQRRACVGHLAKSSVLTLSLQSRNETNASLKSGPAKAGPAGPATPPLCSI